MTIKEIIERLEAIQDYAGECSFNYNDALINYEREIEKLIDELTKDD